MTKVCPTCSTTYPDSKAFCPEDGSTLRAAEVHGSLIGNVVADRYLVTDLLGEGGMGKVYLARHVRLPRQAAIKILHRNMVSDPDAVVRFNREAANASRIVHERVATVWDFGETHDGLVYLAMEFVPGRTLKQVLAEDGPMGAERTARLIGQIADGLDAAHRLKIVHRDLKPDNILVWQNDAGQDECKIVDFGIAKAAGIEGDEHALTKTGFVVGTPEYMSPEQIRGEAVDVRSDVYALALVAYRCLTGEAAFDTNTPDRGMMARLNGAPRTLRELLPDGGFSAEVQGVLRQALAIEPAARFASAGTLATALARALHTQGTVGEVTRTAATPQGSSAPVSARAAAPAKTPPATRTPVEAPPVAAPGAAASEAAAPAPSKRELKKQEAAKRDAAKREAKEQEAAKRESAKREAAQRKAAKRSAAPATPPQSAPPQFATPHHATPVAAVTTAPRRRRSWRLPRIPVVRWVTTVAVLGFGWLVLTEGSLTRAIRRATGLAREAETSGMRLVDRAVDQAAATVRSASGGSGGASGSEATSRSSESAAGGASAAVADSVSAAATIAPAEGEQTPPGATDSAVVSAPAAPAAPAAPVSTPAAQRAAPSEPPATVAAAVNARLRASASELAAGDSVAACSAVADARGLATTAVDSAAVRRAASRAGCGG